MARNKFARTFRERLYSSVMAIWRKLCFPGNCSLAELFELATSTLLSLSLSLFLPSSRSSYPLSFSLASNRSLASTLRTSNNHVKQPRLSIRNNCTLSNANSCVHRAPASVSRQCEGVQERRRGASLLRRPPSSLPS